MTGKGKGRFDYDDVQDGAPFEPSPLPKRCRRYVDSDTENTVAAGVLYFVGDEPVDDTEECSCTSLSSSDIASPAPLATVFGGIGARALALSLPDYATIRGSPPDSRKTRTCEIISIPVLALSTPPTFPPLTPPLYIARSGCYSGFANDFPHPIVFSGKKYRTATHLIEALRYMDHAPDFAEKIRKCNSVRKVHKVSDSGRPRKPHWATLLPEMVYNALFKKFAQHEDLRRLLLDTGEASIIYQDPDTYFGDGMDGLGSNVLGKALVHVRSRLREDGYERVNL